MFRRSDFPEGFLFGVATSSYQIEGDAFGGAGRTILDDFAQTPVNVVEDATGDIACDHYHRREEDLDLVHDAHFDFYRFSTSWARALPDGRGTSNAEGLSFYDRLVDGLLTRGITPALTLCKWELPAAPQDAGGWGNPDVPHWFTEYVEVVVERFGDRIESTATINESWCAAWLSHFLGLHALGHRDIRQVARAMHHVLLVHGHATQAMRALGQTNLCAVLSFEVAHPANDSPAAALTTAPHDAIYNCFFLSGLFKGAYPDLVLERVAPHLPEGWQNDIDVIQTPIDWVGVNDYNHSNIAPAPETAWPSLKSVPGPLLPKTQIGWEIYPQRLHAALDLVHVYAGDLPISVTENGAAEAHETDPSQDPLRQNDHADHIEEVRRAIHAGLPVKGHVPWSWIDTYEWAPGYGPRFGLVPVDRETLQRRPKASYHALTKALAPAS